MKYFIIFIKALLSNAVSIPGRSVLQSQYEHSTIIYEEITNLYEQPHAKNIDVTRKERPWGSQSHSST